MPKIASYNTHYEAYAEMLGKPNVHSVFEHILDAYSRNVRRGLSGSVSISLNDISRKRHVGKNSVPEIIRLLEATKIIKCSRDDDGYSKSTSCAINTDRFVSLIHAFIELNHADKKRFTEALFGQDEETLEKLGYSLEKNAGGELSELRGSFKGLGIPKTGEVSLNRDGYPENGIGVPKQG